MINFEYISTVINHCCISAAVKGASGGLRSVFNLQWMSWIRRSPLWLVCLAQHVSVTAMDLFTLFTILILCDFFMYFIFLPMHSLSFQHTNKTVWGVLCLGCWFLLPQWRLVSCPALHPLQPLSIQWLLQPTQAKSQIAFLGLGLVPAPPLDLLPNLTTGIVYQPWNQSLVRAQTGGHCKGSDGLHSKLQELTRGEW